MQPYTFLNSLYDKEQANRNENIDAITPLMMLGKII